MKNEEFQMVVLEQLSGIKADISVIETKIDGIKKIEENSIEALHKSRQNEKDIAELKENLKWSWRTIIGVIIGYIINLIFNIRGGG